MKLNLLRCPECLFETLTNELVEDCGACGRPVTVQTSVRLPDVRMRPHRAEDQERPYP